MGDKVGFLDSIMGKGSNVQKLKMERNVDELLRLLERGQNRDQVIEALGWIGDRRAVEHTIEALRTGNLATRTQAVKALGKFKDRRAVEPLIAATLNNAYYDVQVKAAAALGQIGNPHAVEPLIKILNDEKYDGTLIQEEIIKSLAIIGDSRAIEPIQEKKDSNYYRIQKEAEKALIKFEGDVDRAMPLLEDKDRHVREDAAEVLGWIGDPKAVEPLIKTLNDKKPDVRKAAAKSLGLIRDNQAVEPLINVLNDKHPDVRGKAAEALGKIGDPKAIEPLQKASKDKSIEAQMSARRALMMIEKK